jgi:AraC family transcriptional regulator, transcriptional activator of pobA
MMKLRREGFPSCGSTPSVFSKNLSTFAFNFNSPKFTLLTTKIQRFAEINTFFEATGFKKRTDIADFFVFAFDELPQDGLLKMPPYQKDFYQVSLIIRSDSSSFVINQQTNNEQKNLLYFLSPDHIFSWQRDVVTQGFICYFKPSFLGFYKGNVAQDFSFFDLSEQNILYLNSQQSHELNGDFDRLYKEFYTQNNYRIQILQSFLLSLLFKCKSLNDAYAPEQTKPSKKQELLMRFRNLVNNCYITNKQVGDYAEKLFVTANYLNDIVKEQTGKTAKELVTEKIMTEAKKALQYSTDDIAQVAYNLGFEEPTNFIRFFKTHAQLTPKSFRNQLP